MRRAGVALGALAGAAVAREATTLARLRAVDDPAAPAPFVFPADREHDVALVDGGSVRVAETGAGPPIVFVHGYSSSKDVWASVARALASRGGAHLIALDLRGHGSSSRLPIGATLASMASDVEEVLAHLELEDVVLVGWSIGSIIGQILGARRAPRVGALLMVSTTARGATGDRRARVIAAVAHRPWVSLALAHPVVGPVLLRRSFPTPVTYAVLEAARSTSSFDASARSGMVPSAAMPDTTALLADITVPVTLLTGSRDPITPPAEAQLAARAIAHSRVRIVEGGGHLLPLQCPDVVADEARALRFP